jgi:hypothetical protein
VVMASTASLTRMMREIRAIASPSSPSGRGHPRRLRPPSARRSPRASHSHSGRLQVPSAQELRTPGLDRTDRERKILRHPKTRVALSPQMRSTACLSHDVEIHRDSHDYRGVAPTGRPLKRAELNLCEVGDIRYNEAAITTVSSSQLHVSALRAAPRPRKERISCPSSVTQDICT